MSFWSYAQTYGKGLFKAGQGNRKRLRKIRSTKLLKKKLKKLAKAKRKANEKFKTSANQIILRKKEK